jgi:hypothetical protein
MTGIPTPDQERQLYRVIDHPIDHPSMSVSIPNRSDHTARNILTYVPEKGNKMSDLDDDYWQAEALGANWPDELEK